MPVRLEFTRYEGAEITYAICLNGHDRYEVKHAPKEPAPKKWARLPNPPCGCGCGKPIEEGRDSQHTVYRLECRAKIQARRDLLRPAREKEVVV